MAATVKEVLEILRVFAPTELACSWDNVGLLVDAGRPVDRILTTLDITAAVVEEAAAQNCQLIVSHHPVIFNPLKRITMQDPAAMLVRQGISAICMHTNLDAAPGGVNDTLAGILGIQNTLSFAEGCGRIGEVASTTARDLAALCAERLGAHPQYVEADHPVTRLAEVSGGGGSYLQEAIDLGADCLVTGEAAHHIALLARQMGVGLVVAGHWATEHPIAGVLATHLTRALPDVKVQTAEADRDPLCTL